MDKQKAKPQNRATGSCENHKKQTLKSAHISRSDSFDPVETGLLKKPEQYATLLQNLNGMVYHCKNDRDWTMNFVSNGCLKLTGYTPEEVVGNRVIAYNDLILPEYRDDLWKHWQDQLARRESVETEYRIRRKDGATRWVWERGRGVFNEKGKVSHIEGFITDITDRKNTELEFIRQSTFIQTVLDNLPIGVAVNEIDQGIATYMNRKFSEIYGWPAEELKDIEKFFELVYVDPEYRQKIKARILEDIRSGDPGRMKWEDVVITRRDGSRRYVNAANIPLPDQGIMVSTVMDVTERVRAEEESRKYREQLEGIVAGKTRELRQRISELERFHDATINREIRMKELRDEIALLKKGG